MISTKLNKKLRDEEKASGIDVEVTELDAILEDILERERDAKERLDSEELQKKTKSGKEKAAAEEVRKQALERMGKRNCDDDDEMPKPKKVRKSTADVFEYLSKKSEKDMDFKREELEVRKREVELASCKQDESQKQQQTILTAMMTQMQQQQQSQQAITAMLVQQQQQQTKVLMSLMEKKV